MATDIRAPIGWPLLGVPDGAGRLHYPSLEASVRQGIRIILSTQPGEQLMERDFGAGIERFLAQPNTLATRAQLAAEMRAALERWEPRILLDRVDVAEDPERPARVRAEIVYRLRRTGVVQRLGLTLEFEG